MDVSAPGSCPMDREHFEGVIEKPIPKEGAMTSGQTVLQFLFEVLAGPQADHLAHAVRNVGSVLSGVSGTANAVGAVRKLRARKAPAAPCCCGSCPPRPEAGAE